MNDLCYETFANIIVDFAETQPRCERSYLRMVARHSGSLSLSAALEFLYEVCTSPDARLTDRADRLIDHLMFGEA